MIKRAFFLLLLLLTFLESSGQNTTYQGSPNTLLINRGAFQVDSVLYIPVRFDDAWNGKYGNIRINRATGHLEYRRFNQWVRVAGQDEILDSIIHAQLDTMSLSNRIDTVSEHLRVHVGQDKDMDPSNEFQDLLIIGRTDSIIEVGITDGKSIILPPSSGQSNGAGLMTRDQNSKLQEIEPGAQRNVNADWNQTNPLSDAFIFNKPTIPSVEGYQKYTDTTTWDATKYWVNQQGFLQSYTETDPTVTAYTKSLISDGILLLAIKNVDGAGSGLDADLLDGQHGAYYLDRSNHTGTQPISSISGLQSELDGKEDAFSKGDIVAGTNATISGDLTGRLVGPGDVVFNVNVPIGYVHWNDTVGQLPTMYRLDTLSTRVQNHITADLDLDPNNELQSISRNGDSVTLANGGSVSIVDGDGDSGNELQQLQWTDGTRQLSISDGNTVHIPTVDTSSISDRIDDRVKYSDTNTLIATKEDIADFITTEIDPTVPAWVKAITQGNITQWNAAEPNVQSDWDATSGDAFIQNKPTSLPPSGAAGGDLSGTYPNPQVVDNSHNHTIANVTGLQTTLNGKESLSNKATSLASPDDTKYPTTKAVSDAIAAVPVHDPVTVTGEDYISLSGQVITAHPIDLAGSNAIGTLPVPKGGTGANSLTGYVKGNGTSPMTASPTIPYSDISGTPPIPTQYTDEMAQDAIGSMVSSEFTYNDATPLLSINEIGAGKIAENSSHRFVTDAEKATWNGKQDDLGTGSTGEYLYSDQTWKQIQYSEIAGTPTIPDVSNMVEWSDTVYVIATQPMLDTLSNRVQAHIAADQDLDPSNEIQQISRSGNTVSLSHAGGDVNIEDDDSDSTNELQNLVWWPGTRQLGMSGSGTVVTIALQDTSNLSNRIDAKEDAFSKGDLIQGNGVTLVGDLTQRLVGPGDITVNAIPPDLSGYVEYSDTIGVIATKNDLDDYIPLSEKGAPNGVATLDPGGKVPVSQLPSSIMFYKGVWDASSNTPTLVNGSGTTGWVYKASPGGTVDFGAGPVTFSDGDWAIYNGTEWERSGNTESVVSVNGQQGVVNLNTDDIPEGTALYFTTARARQAYSGGTGINVNNTTGVIDNVLPNALHTGDVQSLTQSILEIVQNAVTNAKLADMPANTLKGRLTGNGDPQDLTPAQARGLLAVSPSTEVQKYADTNTVDATRAWVNQQGYITGYTETDPIYTGSIPDQMMRKGTLGVVDLNDYRETGIYVQGGNANAGAGSNYPAALAGILSVRAGNGAHVEQTYKTYQYGRIYTRYYYNGTWSSWIWLADRDWVTSFGIGYGVQNNNIISGDILSFENTEFVRVSASSTNLPEVENGYAIRMSRSSNNKKIIFYADNGNTWENVKSGATWSGWKIFADRDWVISQIPTNHYYWNYLRANNSGTVTSLDSALPNGGFISGYGTTAWGGADRPLGASYGGYIKFARETDNNNLDFYYNNGHGGSLSRLWFRTKDPDGVNSWQPVLHLGVNQYQYDSENSSRFYAGGIGDPNAFLFRPVSDNQLFGYRNSANSKYLFSVRANDGRVVMDGLSGTGDRMVTAGPTGILSTQSIPSFSTPNLQQVTDVGHSTSNIIQVTGQTGFDPLDADGLILAATPGSAGVIALDGLVFLQSTPTASYLAAPNNNLTALGATGNLIQLVANNSASLIIEGTSGSQLSTFNTRVQGLSAVNPNEFVTLSQLPSLAGYVQESRTITAGNGLTGGGSLAANRTITLGTPSSITLSSTNSVTSTSHTHAFTPGGTTAQYIRGDGSLATFPSIPTNHVTTNTNQTGLTGTKDWESLNTFRAGARVGTGSAYTLTNGNVAGGTYSDVSESTLPTAFTGASINYDFAASGNFPSLGGGFNHVQTIKLWNGTNKAWQWIYPYTSGVDDAPIFRSSINDGSAWNSFQTVASREWVGSQLGSYVTTNTNQLALSGDKVSSGSWHFRLRENVWYNDASNKNRLYFASAAGSNGILLRMAAAGQQMQIRDSSNNIVAFIRDNGDIQSDALQGGGNQMVIADNDGVLRTQAIPSGTVTSVGASIGGNAINVSGSPITSSGTLAFSFTGNSLQYINGSGNLTTFPTIPTYTGSTSISLVGSSFQRASLTGDVTSPANSNTLTIATGAVTSGKIANNAVTFAKMQDINTQSIIGRETSGSGDPEQIKVGAGLIITSGELRATGAGTPSNLAIGTRTNTSVPITNSNGTGATIPAATTTLAGVMTGTEKEKLGNIYSGTYTPTITRTTGGGGTVTAEGFKYSRVGDFVTVSGVIYASSNPAPGAVNEGFRISLPIASNVASEYDVTGHVSGINIKYNTSGTPVLSGNTTYNTADVGFGYVSAAYYKATVTFNYLIQ